MVTDILTSLDFRPLLPKGWEIRFSPRFITYRPSFEIEIETPKYLLKTASKMSELINVFELRFQIFLENTKDGAQHNGYDIDALDSICDHIIIIDKESSHVVGTYRVISSLFSDRFYSEGEFDIKRFLKASGEKMELGRACIHHGHRNGAVIDLLWKGICRYIKMTDAKYLFGCSSVKTVDQTTSKIIYDYLNEEGLLKTDFGVTSIGKYAMDMSVPAPLVEVSERQQIVKNYLPSLLRSYFQAGSRVYGPPALDIEFECIDFLTILNVDEMSSSYKRRYMGQA